MGFENDVLVCNNVNFNANAAKPHLAQITTNGQLLIGSTAYPNIRPGVLTSPHGTISIGYSSPNITIDVLGEAFAYTAITHATGSPYVVLSTDYYISCDPTAGTITINLPNAPTTYREFVIKDRTGQASINNISVTTVGGIVTIDGQTTYKIVGNYGAINLLFNGTSYEVY
jgi:hypothetical protein